MASLQPPDHVRLDDIEPLGGAVLQVFLDFLLVEALKDHPGGVTQVKEGLVVLVDEMPAVAADFQSHPLHGRPGKQRRVGGGTGLAQHATRKADSAGRRGRGCEELTTGFHRRTPMAMDRILDYIRARAACYLGRWPSECLYK